MKLVNQYPKQNKLQIIQKNLDGRIIRDCPSIIYNEIPLKSIKDNLWRGYEDLIEFLNERFTSKETTLYLNFIVFYLACNEYDLHSRIVNKYTS